MRYTKATLLADLKKLGIKAFDWPGDKPGQVRPEVRAGMSPSIGAGVDTELAELAEYCWKSYEKSLNSSGNLLIGRVQHLQAAGLYAKVAEIVGDRTLFHGSAQGNLLQMDKWALVMNDAWILGGVHRQGLFQLASPRVMDNLWNKDGYFIVTAREIIGLLHFGYQFEQIGMYQCFVSKSPVRATSADLIKYDALIKKKQTLAKAQDLFDPTGSARRVQDQVEAFHNR